LFSRVYDKAPLELKRETNCCRGVPRTLSFPRSYFENCDHLAYGTIVTITFRSPVNECSNSL
jgi:hypothetical protein